MNHTPTHALNTTTSPYAVVDPVCGMTVDPDNAAGSFEYQGKTYYFCSAHCLHRFRENPESFLNKTQLQPIGITRRPKPVAPDQKYTCPMHPQVARFAVGPSNPSPSLSIRQKIPS